MREVVAESDVDPTTADEELADAYAATLPLAPALMQFLAVALAR
jgi:hypothetical protein